MIYQACLGLISIIKPPLQHPKCHGALQVLYFVKKKKKSLVGLQALIYSWPVYDIPSGVLLLCSSPSNPLSAISQQTASASALCPGCRFPPRCPEPALPRRCRITQHCSGHTLCSAVGFPQPPCLLLALRCHCSQGPAPPLPTDATSVSWGVGLEAVSVRSQAEPCSAKDRLFGGQVQNANFCCNRHGPELVCK